ncbi:GNAT family N-acetyltransferase [Spirosoma sp. 209]|uniref:GNAT family N-acetyltransferase n=1 Tax=Spirosoma sp. 209 TaxID=1955701 RepID=UPI00098D3B6E|nr:GNAT family N-acetyltransferase [Spirosoma sp. 209]
MNIQYERVAGLPAEPLAASFLLLLSSVFSRPEADLLAELHYQHARTPLLAELAIDPLHEQVVGCKLGYERKPGHFYSWLGCVDPTRRGQGIASELMRRQHDWCRDQGYHTIRTQTYNQWREMLILNLRFGFAITGTLQGPHGLTIVLEKSLR